MPELSESGVVTLPANHPVDQIVAHLQQVLEAKGIQLFALIDHSGEAERAGLHMPNTKLLIFGNPKAGTPLMLASPTIALDLPLKILIWEDTEGKSWITYNSPDYLRNRHNLAPALAAVLGAVSALANEIAR